MVLSDRDIRRCLKEGKIVIDPLDNPDVQIQPASVDLRLGNEFKIFRHTQKAYVDPLKDDVEEYTETIVVKDGEPFVLHPGEFVLACTKELVELGDDIVARVEGRSSLGRLALLVHASLPYEEEILFRDDEGLRLLPIGEVVEKQLEGEVLAFDPVSRGVRYLPITGWLNNRRKRIFEVVTHSGRRIRLSESHNLFTLDAYGDIVKIPTVAAEGSLVIASYNLPSPEEKRGVDLLKIVEKGPGDRDIMVHLSSEADQRINDGGLECSCEEELSLPLEQYLRAPVGRAHSISHKLGDDQLPVRLPVTLELAYALGLFTSMGRIEGGELVYPEVDREQAGVLEGYFRGFGAGVRIEIEEASESCRLTVSSPLVARVFRCLGFDNEDNKKTIPDLVWSLGRDAKEAFLQGLLRHNALNKGEACIIAEGEYVARRISLLCSFLGYVSRITPLEGGKRGEYEVRIEMGGSPQSVMHIVPVPGGLLKNLRLSLGLPQRKVALTLGYSPSTVSKMENMVLKEVPRGTLQRFARYYMGEAKKQSKEDEPKLEMAEKLYSLAFSPLVFDRVVEVRDTGRVETTYDIEVFPVENFLSGSGVFLSNTAGYIDPGFKGNLTLELSNVGKMPIALYPGMRICQLSFEFLSSKVKLPYGHPSRNSKYQGQRGPTSSRIHLDRELE